MKTLSELKNAIEQLPRKDLFALGEWMRERCEDASFKDFALSSALRGMEDEPDLYREEGGNVLRRSRGPRKVYMITLTEIKAAIEQLPAGDLRQLNVWIADLCWEEWDREIEEDAKAGRLDKLVEQSMAEVRTGKCKPLRCQGVAAPSLRNRRPFDAGGPVQTIRNDDGILVD